MVDVRSRRAVVLALAATLNRVRLTPTQRYFPGYALGWMSQQREAALRNALLSDVHSPAKWRVLGPLSNIPEFYEAFGVKPGQPMWRPESEGVHVW